MRAAPQSPPLPPLLAQAADALAAALVTALPSGDEAGKLVLAVAGRVKRRSFRAVKLTMALPFCVNDGEVIALAGGIASDTSRQSTTLVESLGPALAKLPHDALIGLLVERATQHGCERSALLLLGLKAANTVEEWRSLLLPRYVTHPRQPRHAGERSDKPTAAEKRELELLEQLVARTAPKAPHATLPVAPAALSAFPDVPAHVMVAATPGETDSARAARIAHNQRAALFGGRGGRKKWRALAAHSATARAGPSG